MRLRTTLQLAALFPILLAALFIVFLFAVYYHVSDAGGPGLATASTVAVLMGVIALLVSWRFYSVGERVVNQIDAMAGLAERVRHGDLTPAEIAHDAGEVSTAAEVFSELVGELQGYVRLIRAHDALKQELKEAHDTAERLRDAAMPMSGALELLTRAERAVTSWLLTDDLFLLTWLPPGTIRRAQTWLGGQTAASPPDVPLAVREALERLFPEESTNEAAPQLEKVSVLRAMEDASTLCEWKWGREQNQAPVQVRVNNLSDDSDLVLANHHGLVHIFASVLANAAEAMPNGGAIEVQIRVDESGTVNVAVVDQGTGMSETMRRHCLRPFFSKHEDRLGIGLSVATRLISRWGGRLGVLSENGQGTTVHLAFPRPRTQEETVAVAHRETKPLKILVVDDDEAARKTIEAHLMADRHRVTTAKDGAEAILLLRQKSFDVVMTDRAMPIMSGDELAVAVKARSPQTSVIMVTGMGEVMERQHRKPEGVDVIVPKPVMREDLKLALGRAAELRPDRRGQGQKSS